MILDNEFLILPKSRIKAGEGTKEGKYRFFTSSNDTNFYIDKCLYNDECVILGTGGVPSCNYFNGKFSVSTDNFVLKSKNGYSPRFLYYFLRYDNYSILDKGFHGAGLKHIRKSYVENIQIPNNSLISQKMIVRELDLINSTINSFKNKLSFFDELIKSRFNFQEETT